MRIPEKSGGRPHLQTSVDDPYEIDDDYIDITTLEESTRRYMHVRTGKEVKTDYPVVHRNMLRGM